jgi:CYTH domain-containing protein
MTKTSLSDLRRLFLIQQLPEPLTPASAHLQIFDNYIEGTRLRLRLVRDPASKTWTRILQQRIEVDDNNLATTNLAEIYLNDNEYSQFEQFEGREIRKNRYFHEFDLVNITFDVYLGDLWGLNTARIDFDTVDDMEKFEPPPFAIFEITNDPFFLGKNLIGKKFDDVRVQVGKLGSNVPLRSAMPDE